MYKYINIYKDVGIFIDVLNGLFTNISSSETTVTKKNRPIKAHTPKKMGRGERQNKRSFGS